MPNRRAHPPTRDLDREPEHRPTRLEIVPGTDGVLCGPGCDCAPDAPPEPTPSILRVESLTCRYRDVVAFRDVDLDLPAGLVTTIIGPSGCGKSSFLACLNRLTDLVDGCRVEGRIHLGSNEKTIDVLDSRCDLVALRRRVGLVFQKPNPFALSIRRNLELPLREHGVRRRDERAAIVEHTLRAVGLWDEVADRLDRPALELSGGQQQRLCIARALALEPDVLLCDEPCSALDPLASAVVEDLLASLRDRCTVVVVTHNLAQARRLGDRTAFFWHVEGAGRLVESGPTAHLFERPEHPLTEAYIRGVRG